MNLRKCPRKNKANIMQTSEPNLRLFPMTLFPRPNVPSPWRPSHPWSHRLSFLKLGLTTPAQVIQASIHLRLHYRQLANLELITPKRLTPLVGLFSTHNPDSSGLHGNRNRRRRFVRRPTKLLSGYMYPTSRYKNS